MKNILYPNIRAEMARRGLNGDDMASVLKIDATTWRSRMRGSRPFTVRELRIMSALFDNCKYEYLVEGAPEE